MASLTAGQGSLRQLPSPSHSSKRSVSSYSVSDDLRSERKTLSRETRRGIEVLKVAKNGKLQPRRVAFSLDNRSIIVTSNRIRSIKGLIKFVTPQSQEVTARGIDVSMIERIQRGQVTNRFFMAKTLSKGNDVSAILDKMSNCVSIIYRVPSDSGASFTEGISGSKLRGPHRFESLDLVIPKDKEFVALVTALEDIVSLYHDEIKQYDRDMLLLDYHWLDMELELTQPLSLSNWTNLCSRLNVPLKKAHLVSYYKDFAKEKDVEEVGLTRCLTLELIDEIRIESLKAANLEDDDDPLHRLWLEMVETDPVPSILYDGEDKKNELEIALNVQEETISAVAFLSFIRSSQKEYKTTLEKVQGLIDSLNLQEGADSKREVEEDNKEVAHADRLRKSRFMSYILSDANDIMHGGYGSVGSCDMNQPISHYWINTSHDTYLSKLPNAFVPLEKSVASHETVDVQMFMNALIRGVRCVEVDCWDGPSGTPVVARGELASRNEETSIPFEHVLQVLRCFLRSTPYSYPIILAIENHCSLQQQVVMAKLLRNTLDKADLLFVPTAGMLLDSAILPSPDRMRGKVVIKGKRPKVIKPGAIVMNDDYDDENDVLPEDTDHDDPEEDEDEGGDDEEIQGYVVGFEASGPIKTNDSSAVRQTPAQLLRIAEQEAAQANMEAADAELRAKSLSTDAVAAEKYATRIADEAGLSAAQVKNKAAEENKLILAEEEGTELDLASYTRSLDSGEPPATTSSGPTYQEEAIEVQDFFGDAVEGAKSSYSVADANALEASAEAAGALDRLHEAEEALNTAELELKFSRQQEQASLIAASKAAAEARANREHAETARQRVETVKKMLRTSRASAANAETVVVTAMTEAKISEQRAAETEARASRALATAEKDRSRADEETNREEALEQETSRLHEVYSEYNREAKEARERMEKAASMLDRVNEQIKLIESSSQFVKEMREERNNTETRSPGSRLRHGGKFIEKHAAKLEERDMCTNLIKEASNEHSLAEMRRRRAQEQFEETAQQWKIQADIASSARKQADRSSQHAEELAEHAEEEREAASLRHIAREKAQQSVETSDTYRSSIQAQLAEASRASEEAASLALESRNRAEKLSREAELAKDHDEKIAKVEKAKEKVAAVKVVYENALEKKRAAEEVQKEAKRLMDTSSEVYTNAKRDAAAEVQKATALRLLETSAVRAYGKAILCRKQAEHARALADMAAQTAADKTAAARHARAYKHRKDRINVIAPELAKLTLINSTSYKRWDKSHSMPRTCMHSFSQERLVQVLKKEGDRDKADDDFVGFTVHHLMRTFPPWNHDCKVINIDPTIPQALGCQMVSMNQHSSDEHLLVNDGRFRMNGSCGYVLKPPELLDPHLGKEEKIPEQHWRFTILSAACLPRNEGSVGRKPLSVGGSLTYISPFVQVSLYGGDLSTDKVLHTTNVAVKNGLNPIWDEEDDEFDFLVKNPSIGIILFSVWDDDSGDFVAGSAVPVACLREGYRSVALFDSMHTRAGPYAFSSLLVRSQKLST